MLTLNSASGSVELTFADFNGALNISTDAQGDTFITDPAGTTSCGATNCPIVADFGLNFGGDQIKLALWQTWTHLEGDQTPSVSLGGPGNDNFVFHSSIGAEINANSNSQAGPIEFGNLSCFQHVEQQLAAIITNVEALIGLDHNGDCAPPEVGAACLHAHLSTFAHLL